ncbi:MAG: sugar ABC transporter ATP-binding protein [Parasporobacterium sp.]|nr:sugar ABC transporter ATP-binding protein [Parasporobacterium sp.]
MSSELIRADKIVKNFGLTKALQSVDFTLHAGEIRGLIGENGSGKSTLCSIISGVYGCDSGELYLKGEAYKPISMVDAQKKGVAMILQEMGTITGIKVADNIFIGKEKLFTKGGLVNRKKMYSAAKDILTSLGADDIDPKAAIDTLNFEDRKLVEIARAMYDDPDILIVDETTTALSQRGRDIIYRLCDRMAAEGKGIIFISHDLDEIMEHCTALTVLRDGVLIDTLDKDRMEPELIKSLMVGREMVGDYYRSDFDPSFDDEVVLSMKGIYDGRQLKNFNLELHKGEILGIGGLSDCGMHEVGRLAFGIEKPMQGSVTLGDGTVISQPSVATEHRVGYISKNRDQESLMITATVAENIELPSLKDLSKGGLVFSRDEKKLVEEQRTLLSIKCADVNQSVNNLSGGNKQKVVFGRWIGNKSEILILDCPTRGVDIGVKQAMYQLMYKLKKEGKSIILISEELAEIIGMSDRILIMKDGVASNEIMRSKDVTEHTLIEYMI